MIECTDAKILKKRNRGKGKKRFFSFLIVGAMLTAAFLYSKFCISAVVVEVCSDYAYSYCTQSVNMAIVKSFSNGVQYSEMVKVEKNDAGDITLMSTDSLKVNSISQNIVVETRNNLEEKLENGIPIPWLAFSGIKLLAGYGEKVAFKAITVSSVECDFKSKFQAVGINQTLHSIYSEITCEVNIGIPLDKRFEKFVTSVLISEAVLVGKVPEVYLNGNLFS